MSAALAQTGVIHFASFFLAPCGCTTYLVFEVVADEGLRPATTVRLLVRFAFTDLWAIYGDCAPDVVRDGLDSAKTAWLEAYLAATAKIADGAFVGVRDRSVRQIVQESRLVVFVRRVYSRWRIAHPSVTADEVVDLLTRCVAERPSMKWVKEPAPRSYWRSGGAAGGGKLRAALFWPMTTLLLVTVLWVATYELVLFYDLLREMTADVFVAFLGPVRFEVPGSVARFIDRLDLSRSEMASIVHWVVVPLTWAPQSVRLLLDIVGIAIVWAVIEWLPSLLPTLHRAISAFEHELDLAATTYRSTCLHVVVLAAVAWIGAALTLLAFWEPLKWFGVSREALQEFKLHWLVPPALGLVLAVEGIWAYALWAHLGGSFRASRGSLDWWFTRPRQRQVARAMQVGPSIERCEAALRNETAHLISLVSIRSPYAWNRLWIRFVLLIVTVSARLFYTEGRLGNAPGIKFAHWHFLDDRWLLFCSNYDGAFGGYLDDFIAGASHGLNAIWRFTELKERRDEAFPEISAHRAWPPTRLLIYRGIKREQWFKTYVRESMLPHLYRFDRYNLTFPQIDRGTRLRDALAGQRSQAKDDQLLRSLTT